MVARLVLTGLGAAVSPVAVMVLVSMMMTKNPKRNSLLFLAGYTLALLAIGVLVVALLPLGGSGKKSAVDGYIDLALGILCLVAIPLTLLGGKKKKEKKSEGELNPLKAFSLGIITMVPNSSTLVIFIAGLHMIIAAHLEFADEVISVALLTLVTLLTLLIPIAFYLAFPEKAQKVLVPLKDWLARNKKLIGAAIFLVFGVYLLIKGLTVIF